MSKEFEDHAIKISQGFEEAQRILFGPITPTALQSIFAEEFLKQNSEALASQFSDAISTHDESQLIEMREAFIQISMGIYHWKFKPKGTDNGYRINTKRPPLI